jgi:hypothetical protein
MPWDPPIPGRALCRGRALSPCRSPSHFSSRGRLFEVGGGLTRPSHTRQRGLAGDFGEARPGWAGGGWACGGWARAGRVPGACRARAVREQGESTRAGASRACASGACASSLEQGAREGAISGKSTRAGCASRRQQARAGRVYAGRMPREQGKSARAGSSRRREEGKIFAGRVREQARAGCASRQNLREQGARA